MKSKIVPQKFLYILFNPLYKLLIGGWVSEWLVVVVVVVVHVKRSLSSAATKLKKEREIFSFIEATVLCNFSLFLFLCLSF